MINDFFSESGFIINNIQHLSAREAFELISKGAVLIDIREDYLTNMKTFKVDNYFICPLSSFDENITTLPKDKSFIVADSTGLKSKTIVEKLLQNGFSSVANLAGGIMDWERDGFPVSTNPHEQLSGQCPCMLKPMNKIKKSKK